MSYFGFQVTMEDKHNCCDNCRKDCECHHCSNLQPSNDQEENKEDKELYKTISDSLLVYFSYENALIEETMLPEAITGLSASFAEKIGRLPYQYSDGQSLRLEFPTLKAEYAGNIAKIIQSHIK